MRKYFWSTTKIIKLHICSKLLVLAAYNALWFSDNGPFVFESFYREDTSSKKVTSNLCIARMHTTTTRQVGSSGFKPWGTHLSVKCALTRQIKATRGNFVGKVLMQRFFSRCMCICRAFSWAAPRFKNLAILKHNERFSTMKQTSAAQILCANYVSISTMKHLITIWLNHNFHFI
jgi:hypothetical protein